MNRTKILVEGAVSVALFICLLLVTFYIPFATIIFVWVLPLPLIYYTVRHGIRFGLISLVVSLVLSFLLTGLYYGLFAVFFLISGFAMGYALRLKKSSFAVLLAGSLANIVVLLIYFAGAVVLFHFNPIDSLKSMMNQSLDMAQKISPVLNEDTKKAFEFYRSQISYIGYLAPSLLVVLSIVYAFLIELICLPILRRLRVVVPKWLPFRLWHFPRSLIWYYLVALVIMLFGHLSQGNGLFIVVINVVFILDVLLIIQGLSFVFYFAHEKSLPLVIPILIAIVSLAVSFLLQFIRILGIIDLGFNIRERLKTKK